MISSRADKVLDRLESVFFYDDKSLRNPSFNASSQSMESVNQGSAVFFARLTESCTAKNMDGLPSSRDWSLFSVRDQREYCAVLGLDKAKACDHLRDRNQRAHIW